MSCSTTCRTTALDESAVGVEDVEQLVRIQAVRRREENHLKVLAHALQELHQVWPQPHKYRKLLPAVLHGELRRVRWQCMHRRRTLVAQFCSSSVEQCTSVSSCRCE